MEQGRQILGEKKSLLYKMFTKTQMVQNQGRRSDSSKMEDFPMAKEIAQSTPMACNLVGSNYPIQTGEGQVPKRRKVLLDG